MPVEVWSRGDADANMDQRILVRLAECVRAHPWWHSRTTLARWLLRRERVLPPARVLDAGCGWGSTFLALESDGYRMTGADISRQMLEQLDASQRRLAVCDLTQATTVDETFAAVLAMDVIEHIDDDVAAARQLCRFLHPGGLLILSVPARPELYGEFDTVQGHRRRYTAETLKETLQTAGFGGIRLWWWGQLIYYFIRHQRAQKKGMAGETPDQTYLRYLELPGYPVRWLMQAAFCADRWLTRWGVCRTGTSLLAVARRPA
jgi:2-polyprenyl-3-methyl-5-hydroxy-6-metoxy-1,4-benzoquinol methylase